MIVELQSAVAQVDFYQVYLVSSKNICDFLISLFSFTICMNHNRIYMSTQVQTKYLEVISPPSTYIWAPSFLSIIWELCANIKEVIFNQSFLLFLEEKEISFFGTSWVMSRKEVHKAVRSRRQGQVGWGKGQDLPKPVSKPWNETWAAQIPWGWCCCVLDILQRKIFWGLGPSDEVKVNKFTL